MRHGLKLKQALLSGAMIAGLAVGGNAAAETLGALMPMTGDLQVYGETSLNGVIMAVEQVNEAGGVNGNTLDLVVGDTQTNPQGGVDAAQKLVSVDGATVVVGALSSGVTIPIATSVTSVNGIPQISTASTSPVITTLDDNDFLFRSVPSDALQGVVLANVTKEAGHDSVGVLYINNDYGKGLAETFEANFDGDVVSLAYEPGQASYRGELREAAANDAEALILIGYPENGITILRQGLEEGYFDTFIFTDGMKAPEIIDAIGEPLNGSIGTTPQAVADSDGAVKFVELYEARFGELPPKPFIDSAYDAAMLAALAIEKAGSDDPTAIRDALRSVANPPGAEILPGEFAKAKELIAAGEDINYVGAAGSQNFDDNGDVSGTFAFWGIEDGEIVTHSMIEP